MNLVKTAPFALSPSMPVAQIITTVTSLVESWDRRQNIDQLVDHTITLLSALSNPRVMEVGLELLRNSDERISFMGAELIVRTNQELSSEVSKILETIRRMACSH